MPATGRATIGNLPAEVTSFVGRRRELGEVKRRLAESRLVTLTGSGGTGKTRLALQAGVQVRRVFDDGVWFVDLTQLSSAERGVGPVVHEPGMPAREVLHPDLLAFQVAATLRLREQGGGPPLRVLAEQLADRKILLILDNCEHLLQACTLLAGALLAGCPRLRVLATSREPLTSPGEVLFAVPPLPVPDPRQRRSLAELSRCESVTLFLARAEAKVPGLGLSEDNDVAVADLCYRLDGLPLAIELAAARVPVLAPQQILDRLADRFALLSRGYRDAPERQQTLRACMDWSFDLCSEPERRLWARLSVFTGTFELDDVQGVCAGEELPEADLPELLAGLADKSILIWDHGQNDQAETARYRMLETIRDYGQDKLREAGEEARLRSRHRDWYQRLVIRAKAEETGDRQAYWMARLRREHPNLRAAVECCLAGPGEAGSALRLLVSLPWTYWRAPGLFGEGRSWLDRALARVSIASALRARALLVNSYLAAVQGDTATAMRLLTEGEDLARRVDASQALAHAAFIRGLGALFANDLPVAVETLDRAWRSLSGSPDRDQDVYLHLYVLLAFGLAAGLAGDPQRAGACQREMLAMAESRAESLPRSLALFLGGLIAWLRGDLREAAAQEVEALRLKQARERDDLYGVAMCLEVLAWITAGQQRHRRAATLLGTADALWTSTGTSVTAFGHFIGHHTACERQIRDTLGDAAFQQALHEGQVLTYEDVFAFALDEPKQPGRAPQEDALIPLTRREQQVAGLIGQGASNKDIAATLVISQRTAEGHVERILTKLGFTNRAQVAALVAARSTEQDSRPGTFT